VSITQIVQGVVQDGFLHLFLIEVIVFFGAFLFNWKHFEELKPVQNDTADHFRFIKSRGSGVSFYLIVIFFVQCIDKALVDVFTNFTRIKALHPQKPIGTHWSLSPAELAMTAPGPDEGVCCLEVLVHNQPPVLHQSTFMNKVEILVLNVLSSCWYTHPAVQIFYRLLNGHSLFLTQIIYFLLILVILDILFLVLALLFYASQLVVEQLVVRVMTECESFLYLDAQNVFALRTDLVLQYLVVFKIIWLDTVVVSMCIQLLVEVFIVFEPDNPVLGHPTRLNAPNHREDFQSVPLEDNIPRFLLIHVL